MTENDSINRGDLNGATTKDISEKRVSEIAKVFSVSFQNYPLFEYFSNYKYNVPEMTLFWKVTIKTMWKSVRFFSCGEAPNSVAFLVPTEEGDASVPTYIKSGGFLMMLKMGLPAIIRMIRFEDFASKKRKEYATGRCWYFYAFVTLPEYRGKGLGVKVINSILNFLDERGDDCYLETMSETNVEIYKRYGFQVKEVVKVPNSDMTMYSMLRLTPQKDTATEKTE